MPERIRDFQTSEPVDAIACSADGKLVAVASEPADWQRTVEVLDAETGKPVIALSLTTKDEEAALAAAEGRPHFPVGPLAFSPDGNVLAVGTGLGQVKLFHARTGELLRALDDEQAKLAENESPETLKLLPRAMGSVTSLAFSLDGSLLAVCGSSFEDAALRWGHIERGGLREFAVGPGRLKVWDVNAGTLKLDLVGHSQVRMVSFSADGTLLASAGTDITGTGSVIVWDPRTGEKLRTLQQQANAGTHAVAFSPVKKLVVIGSRVYDKEDDTSTTNVTLTYPLSGITEWQRTVPGWANPKAFWPDGSSVVVQCGGESVRLIETGTGGDKHTFKSTDAPPGGRWNGFAIAPQGHRLFVGGTGADGRGFVAVWAWEGASGDER